MLKPRIPVIRSLLEIFELRMISSSKELALVSFIATMLYREKELYKFKLFNLQFGFYGIVLIL